MDRIQHWPSALLSVVAGAENTPFAWGGHDCVTFAAACVRAITGEDPLADVPAWANPREALRVIGEQGGMAAALSARFGDPIAPAWAQRGDVGLLDAGAADEGFTGVTVVVCMGDVWLAPGPSGLQRLPLSTVAQAWRVGR